MNDVDMTGYVQIHVQLSYFSLTCTEECVEKVENCFVYLLFSYVCLLDFMLLVCDDGLQALVVAPNSPVFILRGMRAFMFASKAFSSHFSCFVVDETRHLHADPYLIKTGKPNLGPLQGSKAMVKMSQELKVKIIIIDILAARSIFSVIYR